MNDPLIKTQCFKAKYDGKSSSMFIHKAVRIRGKNGIIAISVYPKRAYLSYSKQ